MTRETVAQRVARGAALLDEKVPDWWQCVEPGAVTVLGLRRCLVATVTGTGNYQDGLDVLGIPWDGSFVFHPAAERGFEWYTRDSEPDPEHGVTHHQADAARLGDEWAHVITERRQAAEQGAGT